MIIITQALETGEIVGRLEAHEILEYLATCEKAGRTDLAKLVEGVELNPPGEYEIHRDERTKTLVLI